MSTNNAYAPPAAPLDPTTKICQECGAAINKKAEICPKCGVRQKGMVNKTVLLLITFFLGGLGGHKFYLRKPVQGVFYLLFFWTWIPGLIALVEFFIYAFTDEERLNEKYDAAAGGSVVVFVVVGLFGFVFVIGILAAIAIPAYQDYTIRARTTAAFNEANSMKEVVAHYIAENGIPATAEVVPKATPRTVPNLAVVRLEDRGRIVIRFDDSVPSIGGTTLELTPRADGNMIVWDCLTGTMPNRYRPSNCRPTAR